MSTDDRIPLLWVSPPQHNPHRHQFKLQLRGSHAPHLFALTAENLVMNRLAFSKSLSSQIGGMIKAKFLVVVARVGEDFTARVVVVEAVAKVFEQTTFM